LSDTEQIEEERKERVLMKENSINMLYIHYITISLFHGQPGDLSALSAERPMAFCPHLTIGLALSYYISRVLL